MSKAFVYFSHRLLFIGEYIFQVFVFYTVYVYETELPFGFARDDLHKKAFVFGILAHMKRAKIGSHSLSNNDYFIVKMIKIQPGFLTSSFTFFG